MRHLAQKYFANPTEAAHSGLFGYSQRALNCLVEIAHALHAAEGEFVLGPDSGAVKEDFHREVTQFLGIDPATITRWNLVNVLTIQPAGVENIEVIFARQVDGEYTVLQRHTLKIRNCPALSEVKRDAYCYTDNPLAILVSMFHAFQTCERVTVSSSPFGMSRAHFAIFARMYIEMFNLVCTYSTMGRFAARKTFLPHYGTDYISVNFANAKLRNAIVTAADGRKTIVLNFVGRRVNGQCYLAFTNFYEQGNEDGTPLVNELCVYKFDTNKKRFFLNQGLFDPASKLNRFSDLQIQRPNNFFPGDRLERCYQVCDLAECEQLERQLTGQAIPGLHRSELTGSLTSWYQRMSQWGERDTQQYVSVVIINVLMCLRNWTWTIKIHSAFDLEEVQSITFDVSSIIKTERRESDNQVYYTVSPAVLEKLVDHGFELITGLFLKTLARTTRRDVVIRNEDGSVLQDRRVWEHLGRKDDVLLSCLGRYWTTHHTEQPLTWRAFNVRPGHSTKADNFVMMQG